jgi:hypothetical protein
MPVQRYRRVKKSFESAPHVRTPVNIDVVGTLDDAIAKELAKGGRLESRSGAHAVVLYGAGNVLLHITFAALPLFVSGFFVFPWIVWANTIRQRRVTLDVDLASNVIRGR